MSEFAGEPVRIERHRHDTPVRHRFRNVATLFLGEGSQIYAGDEGDLPCVVVDEGTMADLFGPEDADVLDQLVSVLHFASRAERETWVRQRLDVLLIAGASGVQVDGARRWLATRR